jgi:prepilin-type N-terminal cleavage/methylation domain-containing protein
MLLPPSLHTKKTSSHRGFTLVEMLVAMAIFITLTSVLLLNYNNFNTRLNLDILAHQIAQWSRDAQVSAMSVRPSRTDLTKFSGFGLHFDASIPTSFIYFADLNGDKRYAPLTGSQKCGDPGVECEKRIQILKKNSIEQICGSTLGHAQGTCATGLESVQNLDIVFTRPNPDASIIGEYVVGAPFPYAHADITVISPKKYRRTIQVWTTGQISVQ